MSHDLESLCRHPVFRHFRRISDIPRGSGNEEAVSRAVFDWARARGLEARLDEARNVFVRKGATPGCEAAPGVLLQAHLDMVCEKAPGVEHDFTRDPIPWVVEGDLLTTGGRTTLGADNGVGAAMMLAILEDDTLTHPTLEALFTVMEEDDMSGAARFDASQLRSRYLLNLDNFREDEVICGSCGGMRVDFRLPVTARAPEGVSCRVQLSGLRGGHSGGDIHRGRDSANSVLTRLLLRLAREDGFSLGPFRGGSFRLAIPREAEAVVWVKDPDRVRAAAAELEEEVRRELPGEGELRIQVTQAEAENWCVGPERVLDALALIPDGIDRMSGAFPGTVDTSDNLGEVYLSDRELHLVLELRSATESRRSYLYERMERLARLLGGSCAHSCVYPGWSYRVHSPLREQYARLYRSSRGTDPLFRSVHGGLEVGYFLSGCPELDAISVGPNCRDYHSPWETLEIGSTERVYDLLLRLLEALSKQQSEGSAM